MEIFKIDLARKYTQFLSKLLFDSGDIETGFATIEEFKKETESVSGEMIKYIESTIRCTGDRELVLIYSAVMLASYEYLWSYGLNRKDLAEILESCQLTIHEKNSLIEQVKINLTCFSSCVPLEDIIESALIAHECVFNYGGAR